MTEPPADIVYSNASGTRFATKGALISVTVIVTACVWFMCIDGISILPMLGTVAFGVSIPFLIHVIKKADSMRVVPPRTGFRCAIILAKSR